MGLNDRIDEALGTLEALYFLTGSLKSDGGKHLDDVRKYLAIANKKQREALLKLLDSDVASVKDYYGAFASNRVLPRSAI